MHKRNHGGQDRQENDNRKPSAHASGRVLPTEADPGRFKEPHKNPSVESSVLKKGGGEMMGNPEKVRKGKAR